jgi:hypothetical protein
VIVGAGIPVGVGVDAKVGAGVGNSGFITIGRYTLGGIVCDPAGTDIPRTAKAHKSSQPLKNFLRIRLNILSLIHAVAIHSHTLQMSY